MEQQPNYPPGVIAPGMGSMPAADEKIWVLVVHLAVLVGLPIIAPLVIYLVNKDQSPFITLHAKEVLNFHLSSLIWTAICFAGFWLVFPLFFIFVIWALVFVFGIVGGIRGHEGGFMPMPLTVRMIT